MRFIENEIYHVYNRGNNHQPIFFNDDNYLHFINKIRKEWKPLCEILAWCLMPNHFHFMISATESSCKEIPAYGSKLIQSLARKIGLTLSSYSHYINHQNSTSGSLFQQKTKAKCISLQEQKSGGFLNHSLLNTTAYITTCMHYIHQNPMKAGLVKKMEDWNYSSFRDYTGLRNGTLCNKKLMLQLTGYDDTTFYNDSYNILDDDMINGILE